MKRYTISYKYQNKLLYVELWAEDSISAQKKSPKEVVRDGKVYSFYGISEHSNEESEEKEL